MYTELVEIVLVSTAERICARIDEGAGPVAVEITLFVKNGCATFDIGAYLKAVWQKVSKLLAEPGHAAVSKHVSGMSKHSASGVRTYLSHRLYSP